MSGLDCCSKFHWGKVSHCDLLFFNFANQTLAIYQLKEDMVDFVAHEAEVIGLTTDFALGGDAGSWVMNEECNLVGLLIATDSNASDFAVGFVSRIGEIEADVEALCGAEFVLS